MSFADVGSWASLIALLIAVLTLAFTTTGRKLVAASLRFPRACVSGVRLANAGVSDFYETRNVLNRRRSSELIDTLKRARREIGIIAISFQRSVVHQGLAQDIVALLREKPNLTVRFALVDPNSPMLPHLAKSSGRSESELRSAISESLRRLRTAQAEINHVDHERLIVRTCEFHLFSTIVAIDVPPESTFDTPKDAFFLIEHGLYGISIDERYTIEVSRQHSEMFRKTRKSYHGILSLENLNEIPYSDSSEIPKAGEETQGVRD